MDDFMSIFRQGENWLARGGGGGGAWEPPEGGGGGSGNGAPMTEPMVNTQNFMENSIMDENHEKNF